MKKMIPLILKGLGVLIIFSAIGFSVYSYIDTIKTHNDNLIIELKQSTDELNERRYQEAEKIRLEKERYVSDLEKRNSILTKENKKLGDQVKELSE